jgi:hypothetical protein
MKKTLIALAVLAVSGAAFAQSTATISGSINVGVQDTGAAGAKAGVASLGGGANAINIVTLEDLGGGMRGGFSGQMRFNASTGDMNSNGNGNAFLHDANVYVGGGFGTIRVGKITELNNCAFDPWACTGGAGVVAGVAGTIGASGSGLVGAQTIQSAVSYASPTINGFSLGYQTSVSSRVNERSVLSLNYANGPVALQVLRTDGTANITAQGALGAASTAPTDAAAQQTALNASYNFGVAKVNVFNAKSENAAGATTFDITAISASMPMGAYTLLAGYAKDKKAAATADTKLAIGANYALSKRTTLGADLFKQEQVGGSTGFTVRARHTF